MQNTAQIWFQFLMSFHPRTPISFFPLSFWQTRVFVNGMHASTTLPIYLHQPNNNNLIIFGKLFCVLYSTFKHWALRWEDGIMLHLTTQLWIIQIKLRTKETLILFYFYFIQSCCSSALRCLFLTGLQRTFNIYLSVLKRIDKYLVDCDNSTMHSGRGRGWYYTHTKHKAYFMLQLLNE